LRVEAFFAVLLRLIAIFLAGFTLSFVPGLVSDWGSVRFSWISGTAFLLLALASVSLWTFPLTIARRLLPAPTEERISSEGSASLCFALAVIAIGIWFLANGIVGVAYWAARLITWPTMEGVVIEIDSSQYAGMAVTASQLVLGIALMLGARTFGRRVKGLAADLEHGA
jgi:uncharacterized membrane protein YbhN (UPF0104 family)